MALGMQGREKDALSLSMVAVVVVGLLAGRALIPMGFSRAASTPKEEAPKESPFVPLPDQAVGSTLERLPPDERPPVPLAAPALADEKIRQAFTAQIALEDEGLEYVGGGVMGMQRGASVKKAVKKAKRATP
eukprot:gnl/TRDRNA2_/TRDRNA2_179366_c0_seq1.p2 gnl/TRDRNA2_/TRDRNA2_179366_c0~~gnl/TRDRNA2_/TRDRNA2_179366_c0_seq1.p2  ORF type:complete len:132 (-),score=37.50 gnl/TRDRNA2_/TRDRNA2_179366_c0_seq1:82-477(-)